MLAKLFIQKRKKDAALKHMAHLSKQLRTISIESGAAADLLDKQQFKKATTRMNRLQKLLEQMGHNA